ncbi:MAG: septation protein IspZ [Bacteriovoracaceae bacterium]|jgi:intracellular septation protein|nr:septation protein IspZ [Bacteriovoracaceae bacterium]
MNQKQFFLISFLPAIAYWYLEENYSVKIALIGGIALSVVEMSLEWFITKHIHTLSKFNFFLILFLGSLSLLAGEGIWFKLQPFFTGLIMGGYLLYRSFKGKSLIEEMMEQMGNPPNELVGLLERNCAILLIGYGFFMAFVAFKMSTSQWLFFKTGGFYIVSGIFFICHFIYFRIRAKSVR